MSVLVRYSIGVALLVAAMVAGVLWGTSSTQAGVERAVRQNFTAAGLLARLQVEGEKLRRYEKEMFIYVAVREKRSGYVAEFETSYTKLLALMDEMLQPSSLVFTDDERRQMAEWKSAAIIYANAFAALGRRAETISLASLSTEQRLGLTAEFNDAIKPAKDTFRVLLTGTEKMRSAKEAAAQRIAVDIDDTFFRLRVTVLAAGLVSIALVLLMARSRAGTVRPARPARALGARSG